jgi:Antibiotic biosynthesis monooxygenase
MILEVASLEIIKGQEQNFESMFKKAQYIISSMSGFISHQLQKSIETDGKYILLVNWETLENLQNIMSGKCYYIIFMIHFQQLNTIKWFVKTMHKPGPDTMPVS